MADELSEAIDEVRREREALAKGREAFLVRIAGPLDRLSEIARQPKQDPKALIERKRQETRAANTD